MALSFKELFLSSDQSKWTGIAIVCAIIAICLSILFNNNDLQINERFALIFVIILFSIPAVLISLFELNCISTKNTSHNWCSYWGWFIFAIIALQCILIIISALMSMITYNEATNKIIKYKEESGVSKENADNIAKDMINTTETANTNESKANTNESKANTYESKANTNESMNTMNIMDTNIIGYNMDNSFLMPLSVESTDEHFKNNKKKEKFTSKKKPKEIIEGFVSGGEYQSF